MYHATWNALPLRSGLRARAGGIRPEPNQGGSAERVLFDLIQPRSSAALVCPDDGLTMTHEQVASLATELAGRLRSAGVERGDRVAIVLPNGPEIVLCLFAIALLGGGGAAQFRVHGGRIPVLSDGSRSEVGDRGGGRAARCALAAARDLPMVEATTARPGRATDTAVGWARVASLASFELGGPDDVALLLHTSGTTSRPKQVPLLQRNLTAQATSIADHYAVGEADISFCVMPLFHVHGIVASTLAQISAGGTVVVHAA